MKSWSSPIYAFYKPTPRIGYEDGRRFHAFMCSAKGCGKEVRRFLSKKDAASTSNLKKHAEKCWGKEVVAQAKEYKNCSDARDKLTSKLAGHVRDGTITASFERQGKGAVTFSHRQHTSMETR